MKIFIITLFAISTSLLSYSQADKPIKSKTQLYTKTALKDFAESAYYQYRYSKNRSFYALVNRAFWLKNLTQIDAALAVEHLLTDSNGREIIFETFSNTFLNESSIAAQIYSLGTSAVTAKNIANYIYNKYSN